jgi:hypothetical protein
MDMLDGIGHTGYLTIPPTAKFLKPTNLALTPASDAPAAGFKSADQHT